MVFLENYHSWKTNLKSYLKILKSPYLINYFILNYFVILPFHLFPDSRIPNL